MTEKDELVEAIREAVWRPACNFQGNIVGGSCPLNEDEIKAAIASIRPTIVHEILRELYRHNKSQMGNWREGSWLLMTEDAFIEFAKAHGFDLISEDGK